MSKNSLPRLIVAATVIVLVCGARPAHAQTYKVGSFQKCSSTGGATCQGTNINTITHNLNDTPRALILWTSGNPTANSPGNSFWWAFGVSDGTPANSRSSAASARDNQTTSDSSRRSAAKALTIVQYSESLQAEADFTSWTNTEFTITWTTNNTALYIIHYLIIGGSGVSAAVVDWTAVAAGSGACPSGCKSVTVGWQPTLVLNFMSYLTTVGAAGSCASGNCSADAAFMLGLMDAGNQQWATSFYSKDAITTTTTTAREQRTDAAVVQTNQAASEVLRAHLKTMDATGFTVQFDTNTTGSAYHIFSLALTGVNFWAGSFNKLRKTADCGGVVPCNQSQSGFGFTPAAVLFSSFMAPTQVNQAPTTHARFGLGITDGTTEGYSSVDDQNGVALGRTQNTEEDYNTDVFIVLDNSTASLNARSTLLPPNGTFDADGFTLKWTTDDEATTEMLYLALGALSPTAVTLTSFTATAMPDGRTRIAWRTGYEVDNVGFRVYREQKGVRIPITTSIVPGSALIGAARGASSGGQIYSWSDVVPPDAGPVQYWLEDVDLKGKSTWHGPIVPAPSRR